MDFDMFDLEIAALDNAKVKVSQIRTAFGLDEITEFEARRDIMRVRTQLQEELKSNDQGLLLMLRREQNGGVK